MTELGASLALSPPNNVWCWQEQGGETVVWACLHSVSACGLDPGVRKKNGHLTFLTANGESGFGGRKCYEVQLTGSLAFFPLRESVDSGGGERQGRSTRGNPVPMFTELPTTPD